MIKKNSWKKFAQIAVRFSDESSGDNKLDDKDCRNAHHLYEHV